MAKAGRVNVGGGRERAEWGGALCLETGAFPPKPRVQRNPGGLVGARDNRTPAGGDAHPSACSARNRGRKASPEWTRRDLDPDLRFARATCCQVAPRAHVDVRRRSRTCSAPRGLRVSTPVRCRSASRTERRSRCPPYASFWFRRHCTKRRISDLLPRGLAVSPVPPRASRSLDH